LVSATNAPLMRLPVGQSHHEPPPPSTPRFLHDIKVSSSFPLANRSLPTVPFSISSLVLQRENGRKEREAEGGRSVPVFLDSFLQFVS
ncbi:hypothetical protein NQZ68_017454, partial [Dissostichus eleginoides]